MVTEDILAAQKQALKGKYIKGYNDFMTCQKSWITPPHLIILSNGFKYIEGLASCKHYWYCSHCHNSRLYEQSQYLSKVKEFIQKESLHPILVTLTLPHKVDDSLKRQRLILDKAVRGFLAESRNKLVKKINQSVGSKGYILRNEVTYNENFGWHPHCHIVQLNGDDYSENQKNLLTDSYIAQLEESGLHLNRFDKSNLQVNFTDNFANLNYLAKPATDLMKLSISNPEKYVEFVQSCNITTKIPLIKFRQGLKKKLNNDFPSVENNLTAREVERIPIPTYLLQDNLTVDEISELCIKA